jgi:hypothetical protein
MSKPSGIFPGWRLTIAAAVGLATGVPLLMAWMFLLLEQPLFAEFGWTRARIALAILCAATATVLVSPVVGRMVDRFGARRITLASCAALALAVGSLYWLPPSGWPVHAAIALLAIAGAGTSPIPFTRALTFWFASRRGFALGLGLAGIGAGVWILPRAVQAFADEFGWRLTCLSLTALILAVTLPCLFFNLRDAPEPSGLQPDGAPPPGAAAARLGNRAVPGYALELARRSPQFRALALAFALIGFGLAGAVVQIIPLLEARVAAATLPDLSPAGVGMAVMLGSILAGWLMDRLFAPHVAIAFLASAVIGLYLLATGAVGALAVTSTALVALAVGAEIAALAYLVGRYFGLRSVAAIHGWLHAASMAGAGLALTATEFAFERLRADPGALIVLGSVLLLGIGVLLRLGSFPSWDFGPRGGPSPGAESRSA